MIYLLKKFTLDDCTQYKLDLDGWVKLTRERLRRLKRKQIRNPAWIAYDKYADEFVGIDIRIEEQQAVLEEQLQDIEAVDKRAEELVTESKRIAAKARRDSEIQIPMELGVESLQKPTV
jgi:hypothetical protein